METEYVYRKDWRLELFVLIIMSAIGLGLIACTYSSVLHKRLNKDKVEPKTPTVNVILGGQLKEINF